MAAIKTATAAGTAPPVTDRQRDMLAAIYRIRIHTGRSPTFVELCEALGFASTNAVETHLAALERKGLVVRVMVDEQDGHNRWRFRSVVMTEAGWREVPVGVRMDAVRQLLTAMAETEPARWAVFERLLLSNKG